MTRGLHVTYAGAVALFLAGCSSSSGASDPFGGVEAGASPPRADAAGPRDAGAPPKDAGAGSPKDAAPAADAGVVVASPGDAGPTCSVNTAFSPVPWAPPTKFHQGACTNAQVTAWRASLDATTSLGTSGDATCDACLMTPGTAAAHGPLVTFEENGVAYLWQYNYGGCVANEDGDTSAGCCGEQYNDWLGCFQQECWGCADFKSSTYADGGATSTCESANFGAGGVCAADAIPAGTACDTELDTNTAVQTCLTFSDLEPFLEFWCGS